MSLPEATKKQSPIRSEFDMLFEAISRIDDASRRLADHLSSTLPGYCYDPPECGGEVCEKQLKKSEIAEMLSISTQKIRRIADKISEMDALSEL